MKKIVLSVLFGVLALNVSAQGDTKASRSTSSASGFAAIAPDKKIYTEVDRAPEYPGGLEALMNYFSNNLHYPASALEKNVHGTVYCKFVVSSTGDISDVTIMKSVDEACDQEAMRVVSGMGKWKPGLKDGKPVSCFYTLPVKFVIPEPAPVDKTLIRDTKDLNR